jgi:carboxymethylenebutenolidase
MRYPLAIALALILVGCGQDDGTATDASVAVEQTAAQPAEDTAASIPITEVSPAVPVISEDVAYGETEEQNLRGYLVLPADAVDPPGIVMIHEWWGLNDNIRAMARRLAGEGYAVLAVDLYGGQLAANAAEAQRLMTDVNTDRAAALENLRQAYRYLDEFVLAPRIGVLGFGLGGDWALEAGLQLGDALDAVVMFYGQIITDPQQLASLDAPLLGIFAEMDESIPAREVLGFKGRLSELGKTAQVDIYNGVDHAFMNPSAAAYNDSEAMRAWSAALAFLNERLR